MDRGNEGRRWDRRWLGSAGAWGATAVVLLSLGACSPSDKVAGFDGAAFASARSQADTLTTDFAVLAVARTLREAPLAGQTPTATDLFNWAESAFPTLFPAPRPSNQVFQTYTYRYYPATDLALGVSGSTVVGLVGALSPSPRLVPLGVISDYGCNVFPQSCNTIAANLDVGGVNTGINEVAAFVAVCSTHPSATPAAILEPKIVERLLQVRRAMAMVNGGRDRPMATYTSSRPADKLGPCGGRITFTSYSHASGTTTATRQFDNYCTIDSDTGNKQTTSGSMSFVNTGTPTASGPITTRQVSNSSGITFVTRNAAGAVVTSQAVSFNNYVYVPGVPGGHATASNPDRVSADELVITDAVTQKNYRQTGYSLSSYRVASGGEQVTISGRGYRSNGQYYDLSTTAPLVTDSSGDYVSGTLRFAGANNSLIVANLVPGEKLQATLTLNGQAVAAPSCAP